MNRKNIGEPETTTENTTEAQGSPSLPTSGDTEGAGF
jgi:hypothetical protein